MDRDEAIKRGWELADKANERGFWSKPDDEKKAIIDELKAISNSVANTCSHEFKVISEVSIGPSDQIMAGNGDSVYEITEECKYCGKIQTRTDV